MCHCCPNSQLLGNPEWQPNPKGKPRNGHQFPSPKITEGVMCNPVLTLTASHGVQTQRSSQAALCMEGNSSPVTGSILPWPRCRVTCDHYQCYAAVPVLLYILRKKFTKQTKHHQHNNLGYLALFKTSTALDHIGASSALWPHSIFRAVLPPRSMTKQKLTKHIQIL